MLDDVLCKSRLQVGIDSLEGEGEGEGEEY